MALCVCKGEGMLERLVIKANAIAPSPDTLENLSNERLLIFPSNDMYRCQQSGQIKITMLSCFPELRNLYNLVENYTSP